MMHNDIAYEGFATNSVQLTQQRIAGTSALGTMRVRLPDCPTQAHGDGDDKRWSRQSCLTDDKAALASSKWTGSIVIENDWRTQFSNVLLTEAGAGHIFDTQFLVNFLSCHFVRTDKTVETSAQMSDETRSTSTDSARAHSRG